MQARLDGESRACEGSQFDPAAQQSVHADGLLVKAKVVCFNGHERVVEGKDFDEECPVCGAGMGEYDSRFGGK